MGLIREARGAEEGDRRGGLAIGGRKTPALFHGLVRFLEKERGNGGIEREEGRKRDGRRESFGIWEDCIIPVGIG